MMAVEPDSLDNTADLEVTISNVSNDEGFILVTLFNSPDGFPDQSKMAFKNKKVKSEANRTKVVFENIPHGTYAIAVLHDQNDNGKLDKNMLGIPTEGYGSSNNQKKLFRAPNFDECKFKVDKNSVTNTITLNY